MGAGGTKAVFYSSQTWPQGKRKEKKTKKAPDLQTDRCGGGPSAELVLHEKKDARLDVVGPLYGVMKKITRFLFFLFEIFAVI